MIDKFSPDWLAVKKRCEAEMNLARDIIEAPGIGPVETEFQRGRLNAFKEVLDFPNQPEKD